MKKKALKVIYICVLFVSLFFCLGVDHSEANGINWTHEWNMTSAYVYADTADGTADVTNNVETSGRVEAYEINPSYCGGMTTCFEINNFEFTLIDALEDEYSWSLYNESEFAFNELSAEYGFMFDIHLDYLGFSFFYPMHDIYTEVGYYGYPHLGSQGDGEYQYGIHLNGGWTEIKRVPEPSIIILLGSGLIGLVAFRKKFKK